MYSNGSTLKNISIFILKMAILGFSFLLPNIAWANCYNVGASGRLANYCALNTLRDTKVSLRSLQYIDQKLKVEGSIKGLGFPARVKSNSISKYIYPILSYSSNINGGNSSDPLVLGNNTFEGDEALFLKEGAIAGLGAGLNGRYIYSNQRYLSYSVNSSYTQSPEYGMGISSTNANSCSVNFIKNHWYIDLCANTSLTQKEITESTSNNISLVSSKLYSSDKGTYNEASFGFSRHFSETYAQNQALIGYKTIHSNNAYSAINFTLGESVENKLAMQYAISGKITSQFVQKPLKLSISYSKFDGGKLLGFDRKQRKMDLSISYPVWKNLNVTLGYSNSDSNIDYYDISTPTFGIQFKPFKF